MYEFIELEDLAINAAQLAQLCAVLETALYDNKSGRPHAEKAMMLYSVLLKQFAEALQDYFDRAYNDWKKQTTKAAHIDP